MSHSVWCFLNATNHSKSSWTFPCQHSFGDALLLVPIMPWNSLRSGSDWRLGSLAADVHRCGCCLLICNPLSADSCNKMPQGFSLRASRGAALPRELFKATQDHCHSRGKAGAGMTVTGIAPLNQN